VLTVVKPASLAFLQVLVPEWASDPEIMDFSGIEKGWLVVQIEIVFS